MKEYSSIFTLLVVAMGLAVVVGGAGSLFGAATTTAAADQTDCRLVDMDGDGSSAWACADGKKVYGQQIDCDDYDTSLGYARGTCADAKSLLTCQNGRVKVTLCDFGCQQTYDGVTDRCASAPAAPSVVRPAGGVYVQNNR